MGTTVKERLEEYLKKNKISARKFYEKAEVANGLLKDTSQYLRDESKEKILSKWTDSFLRGEIPAFFMFNLCTKHWKKMIHWFTKKLHLHWFDNSVSSIV